MKDIKTLGDAIGMPDQRDKDFIRSLILEYEREHPGRIQYSRDMAREEQNANRIGRSGLKEFGLIDKQSARRHLFELPEDLVSVIELQYPTMFREKKHFVWFCKNFKELLIPEKY